MDYSKFSFTAVVDYIEIQIQTAQPTSYDALQRHTGLPYFEAIDPTSRGNSATTFNVKIHDPERWQDVTGAANIIAKEFEFAKPFKVVGIETALDAYAISGTRHDLAELCAWYAHHTTFHDNIRNMYIGKDDYISIDYFDFARQVQRFEKGYNFCTGRKDATKFQHIYLKDHDKGILLETDQHRARLEGTLLSGNLPHLTNEQWKHFNFASLASEFFTFRKYFAPVIDQGNCTVDLAKLRQHIYLNQTSDFGKVIKATVKGRRSHKRSTHPDSKTDKELIDIARYKLRDLSKRWEKETQNQHPGFAPTDAGKRANPGRHALDKSLLGNCIDLETNESLLINIESLLINPISHNETDQHERSEYNINPDNSPDQQSAYQDEVSSADLHHLTTETDSHFENDLDEISFADLHLSPERKAQLEAIDHHYEAREKGIEEAYRDAMKKTPPTI